MIQMFPQLNLSLLLTNNDMKKFMDVVKSDFIFGKYKADEIQQKEQLLYVEDLIYDILNAEKVESDYSQSIYKDSTMSQLLDLLKSLKYDNPEASKFIKTKLEAAI